MAMTKTDACDVQTLVSWITGISHEERPDLGDQAREALIRLADRSADSLSAGDRGGYVRAMWPTPGVPFGCRAEAKEVER